jgi:hypothetical protein
MMTPDTTYDPWERAVMWMLAFALAEQGYRVDVTALCIMGSR